MFSTLSSNVDALLSKIKPNNQVDYSKPRQRITITPPTESILLGSYTATSLLIRESISGKILAEYNNAVFYSFNKNDLFVLLKNGQMFKNGVAIWQLPFYVDDIMRPTDIALYINSITVDEPPTQLYIKDFTSDKPLLIQVISTEFSPKVKIKFLSHTTQTYKI